MVEGPGWLYNDEESWPCSEVSETPDEAFLERRKTVVTNVATENEVRFGDRFLYFSSYRKILRMTAYVLRFCNNIKRNSPKLVNSLSCEEIQKAEETLIKNHGTDIAAQNPGPTATDVLKEGKKSRWGRPLIPVKRLNL
ncbi:DUF1758 domain-containing protein [Trichonephila clavata]|uniref:DUF1758 domain-containing protein n=1 Tax=Trichonephila clavata TaxID=2740835 RepID=A0A8X6L3W0_TRICU|nr:DUF1758 domain-containing protein [Trichonephila clavata]